jgi:hypothetical protein
VKIQDLSRTKAEARDAKESLRAESFWLAPGALLNETHIAAVWRGIGSETLQQMQGYNHQRPSLRGLFSVTSALKVRAEPLVINPAPHFLRTTFCI